MQKILSSENSQLVRFEKVNTQLLSIIINKSNMRLITIKKSDGN